MKNNRSGICRRPMTASPFAMGYLAVSFTLGIAALKCGWSLPRINMSITNLTSAAGSPKLITAGTSTILEMACAADHQPTVILHRSRSNCIFPPPAGDRFTDEIFGSIGRTGMLNPLPAAQSAAFQLDLGHVHGDWFPETSFPPGVLNAL